MNNLILIFINLYEIHISLQKSNTDGSLKGQRGKKEVEVKPKKKRTYKKKKDENPPVTNLKQIDSPRKQYPYEKAIPEKTQTYSEGSYKGQQGKKKPVVRYIKKRTYQKVSSISLKKVSVSEYGQEIPQTHSADQPTALRGRATKH